MKQFRRPTGMTVMLAISITSIAFLLLIPLIVQALSAFRGPFLPFGISSAKWGVTNFSTLYGADGDLLATLKATSIFVIGASTVSLGLGFGLAWLVVRTDLKLRGVVWALVVLPFLIPSIVAAQAYYLMLLPKSGVLNELLRATPFFSGDSGPIDPFAFPSIVIVQGLAWMAFPFMLFVPILRNMDGSLEEAARASGASWASTLRRVTLPILWPGLLGIITLQVILMLGTLEVPLIFGQQSGRDIFALRMWNLISSNPGQLPQYGLAAVYGLHFFALTCGLFLLYLRTTRKADQRASVSGKGFRPTQLPLGRWAGPIWIAIILILIPTSIMPLLAMLWASVSPYPVAFTMHNLATLADFSAFGAVLQDNEFWLSTLRTLIIAGSSATIAVFVAATAAYSVARSRKSPRMKALDLLASSSVAIPGVIAGFSFFLLFLVANRWVAISGTVLALVIAYSYRMSIAYRASFSATLQLKPELEEAGAASGASRAAIYRRIVLPLLFPTLTAVWAQIFILGTTEFTLAAFLATPESRPLSMYVYSRISPRSAQLYAPDEGAAMALIFTILVLLIALASRQLTRRANDRHAAIASPKPDDDDDPPLFGDELVPDSLAGGIQVASPASPESQPVGR